MQNTIEQTNPLGSQSIGSLMMKYSVPAIIGMLVTALYNMVDQVFIGWGIGTLGMAATNVAFPLTPIMKVFGLLMGIGGAANFNLNLGGGNIKRAADVIGNALSGASIFGISVGLVVFVFLEPILYAFGCTDLI